MIVSGKIGVIKSAIGLIVGLAGLSSNASGRMPLLLQPRKKGGLKISYADESCYVSTVLSDCTVESGEDVAVPASYFGFAGKGDDEVTLTFSESKLVIQTARQRSEVALDMESATLQQAMPDSVLATDACKMPAEFSVGVYAVSFSSTEAAQPPVRIEMPKVKKGETQTVLFSSGDSCATAMWALPLKDGTEASMDDVVFIDRNVFFGVVGKIDKKSTFQLGVSETAYAVKSTNPPFVFQMQKQSAITEDSARTQPEAIFKQLAADDQCVGFRCSPKVLTEAIRDTVGIGRSVSGVTGDTSVRFTMSGPKSLVLSHESEAVSTTYDADIQTAYPGTGFFVAPPHLVEEIMKLCYSDMVTVRWWDAGAKDPMKAGTAVIEGSAGVQYAISLENVSATPGKAVVEKSKPSKPSGKPSGKAPKSKK